MGEKSSIEWTDHTFNPWWGCTRVSPGCVHCYAETFDKRVHGKDRAHWGVKAGRRFFGDKHWNEPLRWNASAAKAGVRERVFCASMADVFEDRPELVEHRARLFALILATPSLDWLLLTKRPEKMVRLAEEAGWEGDWPSNVWAGCTVEDQQRADERIPELLLVPAAVRFLSCEPLIGAVDLGLSTATCRCCPRWPSRWVRLFHTVRSDWPGIIKPDMTAEPGIYRAASNPHGALSVQTPSGLLGIKPAEFDCLPRIDWVICGGESGAGARPMHPDWARSLRDQCSAAGVAFFFKQWGEHAPIGPLSARKIVLASDGTTYTESELASPAGPRRGEAVRADHHRAHLTLMYRVGKHAAGRLLDGRTWDELPTPEVAHA